MDKKPDAYLVSRQFDATIRKKYLKESRNRHALEEVAKALVALELGSRQVNVFLAEEVVGHFWVYGACHFDVVPNKLNRVAIAYAHACARTICDDRERAIAEIHADALHDNTFNAYERFLIPLLSELELSRAIALSLRLVKKNWRSIQGAAWDLAHSRQKELLLRSHDLKKSSWRGYLTVSND